MKPYRKSGPARRPVPGARRHPAPAPASPEWTVKKIHHDEKILVVGKPAGLPCLPAHKGRDGERGENLLDIVRDLLKTRRQRPRVWLTDPIDDRASGLCVFALDEKTAEALREQFTRGRVHRVMVAVTQGTPGGEGGDKEGTVRSLLKPAGRIAYASQDPSEFRGIGRSGRSAPDAVTHYRVTKENNGRALVRLRMGTNKPHQARVHLAERGAPVLGDELYGGPKGPRLLLHRSELGFVHPGTGMSERYTDHPDPVFWEAIGLEPPAHAEREHTPAPSPDPDSGSWENVAEWYDDLLSERRSDHHDELVVPGVLELLGDVGGRRVLDVACGQGLVSGSIAGAGAEVVGVDASESLIAAARGRLPGVRFEVGDARRLSDELGEFDAAVCVLAAMNIDPLDELFASVAARLKPGGRFVCVLLHPAFRIPRSSGWRFETGGHAKAATQHRTVSGYLSERAIEITMNPGAAASGAEAVKTVTHHRPLSAYLNALAGAGLGVDRCEEWASRRRSEPGPRAEAENTARAEIPLFLALRALRAERA